MTDLEAKITALLERVADESEVAMDVNGFSMRSIPETLLNEICDYLASIGK